MFNNFVKHDNRHLYKRNRFHSDSPYTVCNMQQMQLRNVLLVTNACEEHLSYLSNLQLKVYRVCFVWLFWLQLHHMQQQLRLLSKELRAMSTLQ